MKPPSAGLAALLSFVAPGVGHAYAGRFLRGAALALAVEAALLPALHALAFRGWWNAASLAAAWGAALAAALVAALAIGADAARAARRAGAAARSRGMRLLAAGAFLVLLGGLHLGASELRRAWLGASYWVPEQQMLPGLVPGDHVLSARAYGASRSPARGEVVVFEYAREPRRLHPADARPDLPRVPLVLRIVGLPGDVLRGEGAALFVNGERATGAKPIGVYVAPDGQRLERYEEALGSSVYEVLADPAAPSAAWGPLRVEAGRVFLLGDHRDHVYDSRGNGSVALGNVLAPVGRVYWSWPYLGETRRLLDPHILVQALRAVRWERLGLEPNPAGSEGPTARAGK
jgi:signal peptidase I